ncbi:MAG: nucleotidyltransferase domain-containing protein [Oscillospiraceae bacterium]|nr:nucleotidyltransferase domain-containing protein [Oscillospiraceae bacterium]
MTEKSGTIPETINQTIRQKLAEIEQTEHVRILHAVESGSRAWGFASPDSDFDVRFIYVRQQADYLKLNPVRDVIESELNAIYDINGWDFKKMLILTKNSNPTVFEWMLSPIVYQTTDFFQEDCKPVLEQYFSCKVGIYHYWNTARSQYQRYCTQGKIKLKKYFYALRPILACHWILQYHTPAPMLFTELAEACLKPAMRPIIQELLHQKIHCPEAGLQASIPELDAYISKNLELIQEKADHMPNDKNPDWDALNQVFLGSVANQEKMH